MKFLIINVQTILNFRDKKQSKKNSATSSTSSSLSKKVANKNIKTFVEKGLLSNTEQQYLEENFQGDRVGCKNCEKLQQESTTSRSTKKRYCSHVNIRSPLSLSAWAPWQTSTQSTSHSTRTLKFCAIMEANERFKSSTEVQDYEKWISSKFKKSDVHKSVSSLSPTSDSKISTTTATTITTTTTTDSKTKLKNKHTHKTPKQKVGAAGRLWRQNINKSPPLDVTSDNSDIDDFSHNINKNHEDINLNNKQQQNNFDFGIDFVEDNRNIARDSEDEPIMCAQKGVVKFQVDLSSHVEDEKFKPHSLEHLLEKEEERLSAQRRKKRVRLTRFPKPPVIDLDVSDIADQQIGFCSQVTMDTLYNRCQKKRKRDQLDVLLENNDVNSHEDNVENGYRSHGDDDSDDSRGSYKPSMKRIKGNGGHGADKMKKKEFEQTDVVKNFLESDGNISDGFVDDFNDNINEKKNLNSVNFKDNACTDLDKECTNGTLKRDNKLSSIPDTQQAFSRMFPTCTPSQNVFGNEHATKHSMTKHNPSKQNSMTIPNAVPEAPTDIELSSFFDSSCIEREDNNTIDDLLNIPPFTEKPINQRDEYKDDVITTSTITSVLPSHDSRRSGGRESNKEMMLSDSILNSLDDDDINIDDMDDGFQEHSSPPIVSQYHKTHGKSNRGNDNNQTKSSKKGFSTADVGNIFKERDNTISIRVKQVSGKENKTSESIKPFKGEDILTGTDVDTRNITVNDDQLKDIIAKNNHCNGIQSGNGPEKIPETDDEEDSPLLVKRPAARNKNRIFDSPISPQDDVKPTETKRGMLLDLGSFDAFIDAIADFVYRVLM